VVAFVDWYNHRYRHIGIKFLTPHQHHCGQAVEICQRRTEVYVHAFSRIASMEPIYLLSALAGSGLDLQTQGRRNPSKGATFDSSSLISPP
jgi:hypothetical protein